MAGDDHQFAATFGQPQFGLHLRDGRAFAQALDRQVLALGLFQHIQFIHGFADDLVAVIAGHLQKTLVDLDVAQVAETADHGGGRVGVEGFLEALLGAGPFGGVAEDQHQQLRLALGIGQHQAAQAVHPAAVFVVGGRDFHHHIAELFTGSHAAEGVAVQWQGVVVAIAQGKALGVRLGIGAQFLDLADPMHGQRRFIGPQNGLVDLGQDHTIGQPGDDGLQLAAVGFFGENILGHNVSD